MLEYRLYLLGPDRHIRRAAEIRANNDDAAVLLALDYENLHGMELWRRARLVRSFSPEGSTVSALPRRSPGRDPSTSGLEGDRSRRSP
jgi:hypothetical protein